MKKTLLLSIVTASFILNGCGEKTKEATTKAASEVSQAVKEDTKHAVQKAKEVTTKVVKNAKEKATEVVQDVKQKAHEVKEDIKEETKEVVQKAKAKVAEVTHKTEEKTDTTGKVLFAKCVACHGADGKNKALNVSALIAGQSASDIATKLQEYKAHKRDVSGMGATMSAQVTSLSDDDIKALAEYISSL